MKRFQSITCLLLCWVMSTTAALTQEGRRPNIVLIVLDDWGWRDASFLANQQIDTPAIDAAAAGGVTFSRAYAAMPNCAPSRACMLTGMYTPRHGVYTVGLSNRGSHKYQRLIPPANRQKLDLKWATFASLLKQAGYRTASIGKWHLGHHPENGPEAFGFDINIGGDHLGSPRSFHSPYRFPNLEAAEPGKYLTDHCGDEALKFLDANKDREFLLYLPFHSPHSPLQPPADLAEKYNKRNTLADGVMPDYAAMVESVDRNVARILKHLDDLRLAENTLVIITSDNGGTHGSNNLPLRGKKGMLYEGGIRIPMIFRWPGTLPAGAVRDAPVTLTDLFPTLLSIGGAKPAPDQPVDGIDLLPVAKGDSKPSRALFWHFPVYLDNDKPGDFRNTPSCAMLAADNHKVIRFFEDDALEIYQLTDDPGESKNIAASQPALASRLRAEMQEWLERTKAIVPSEANPGYDPALGKAVISDGRPTP